MEQVQGKQEDEDSDEDSEEDMELGDEEYLVADDSGAIAEPKAAESLPADKEAADKAAAEKAEEERAEKCRQTFLFMQKVAVEARRAEEEEQRQKKEKELEQTNKREASEKHRAEEKAAKQKNEEARRAEEKEQRQKKQEQLEETNKREASEKHRAEDEAAKQKTEDFWTKRDAEKQRKEQTKQKEEEGKKQKEKKLKEPAKMKAQAEAGPSKTNKNSSTNNREQQRKRKLEEAKNKEEKKSNKEEELQKEKVEAGRKEIETEEQPLQQTIQDKTNAEEEVQNKEEEEEHQKDKVLAETKELEEKKMEVLQNKRAQEQAGQQTIQDKTNAEEEVQEKEEEEEHQKDKVEAAKEPAKRKSEAEAVGSHKSKRLRTNKNYVEKKVESDLSSYESSPSDSSQNDKALEIQLKKKKIYNKGQPRSSRRITYTKAELDVMKLKPAKPGRHNTLQAVLQQENIIDPFNNYLFFWAIGEITPHWVSQRFKDEVLDEAQQKLPNCKTQEDWREFQRPENYEATGNVFAPFPNHQQLVRYQITGEEKQKVLQYALNRCREVVKPLLPKDFKAKIQPGPIPKSNSHGENRAMRIRIASLSKQNKTLSKQLQLAQDTTIEGDPEVVSSGFTMPTSFQSFEEQWNFIRQLLPCMSAPDRKSALGNYNISKVKKFIQTFSL